MSKEVSQKIIQNQSIIIARLSDYCNYTPRLASHYQNDQASFMQDTLDRIEEPVMELKKELLSDACASFISALEKTEKARAENRTCKDISGIFDRQYEDFLHTLDRFVCYKDFEKIKKMLPHPYAERLGDNKLHVLRDMLSRINPISLLEEERRKKKERDPEAEKIISYAYNHIGLAAHEREFRERLKKWSRTYHDRIPEEKEKALDFVLYFFLNETLPAIREDVKEYCCQFQIPANENGEGTLTPFMLPRIEVLIPANKRFFNNVRTLHQYLKP